MPNLRRPSQLEAADDDWQQKDDIDERRRVQNRLSQRKRRKYITALSLHLKLNDVVGSQFKAADDTGQGQKFLFVEPNTVTLSRVKAPPRRHTTAQAATPPTEQTSSLGSDSAMTTVLVEQPAEWDAERLFGFDTQAMDFGNALWDVDMYDDRERAQPLSPSVTPGMHGKSAVLDPFASDMALGDTSSTEASVTAPLGRTDSALHLQKPETWLHSAIMHEPGDPVSAPRPMRALSAPSVKICLDNSMVAGYAALHLAARDGRLAIIKLLVEKGQPIDQLSDNCHTALSLALEGEHLEVMQYLLEQGALPDALSGNGSTVLHLAAKRGQCRAVELLLEHMKDPNVIDRNGCSALHIAVAEGQTEIVRLILDRGVDPQLKIVAVDA
jgi:hypothetical protein